MFAGGTLTALDALIDYKTKLAVHFAGAKHHAMRDISSGFCIFNDFAIAATKATNELLNKQVAIAMATEKNTKKTSKVVDKVGPSIV